MSTVKMAAIALMVAGVLALVYGSFTYTRESHTTKLGALELTVRDRETVNVPVWAGVGALLAGGLLLVLPMRRR